jgi:hypothetical protein
MAALQYEDEAALLHWRRIATGPDDLWPIHAQWSGDEWMALVGCMSTAVAVLWSLGLVAAFVAGMWLTAPQDGGSRRRIENGLTFAALVIDRTPVFDSIWNRVIKPTVVSCASCVRRQRRSTVYNIRQRAPMSVAPTVAPEDERAFERSWLTQSCLERRAGQWQYCLRFIPHSDLVIEYSVRKSNLTSAFLARYERGVAALFPPEPMDVYWQRPKQSPIVLAQWCSTTDSANHEKETTRVRLQVLQQAAGPHQYLGQTGQTGTTGPSSDGSKAHAWGADHFLKQFQTLFKPPLAVVQSDFVEAPARSSRSAARAAARLREVVTNSSIASQATLVVTRANGEFSILGFTPPIIPTAL